ncbi:hypothetical protein ACFV0R_11820 [Streptomyces sp. NPDC059578]|uniref:hypothetical protein n=1 Tax=Streptomyces sp. NPDC059578 TaxID=3346874 RepID=UPI0036780431
MPDQSDHDSDSLAYQPHQPHPSHPQGAGHGTDPSYGHAPPYGQQQYAYGQQQHGQQQGQQYGAPSPQEQAPGAFPPAAAQYPGHHPGHTGHSGHTGHPGFAEQPYDEGPQTQQWQAPTWETQLQPPVPALDQQPAPAPYAPVAPVAPEPAPGPAYGPPQTYGRGTRTPPQGTDPGDPRQTDAGSTTAGNGTTDAGSAAAPAPEPQYATAADRARAEGRPQILEPGLQPAALTAVLALLIAGAGALHQYALFLPVALLQAVTAAGWFRLNGMWPARQGIALAFLGGLVADAALLVAGRENTPAAVLGTLGVWVLLSIVLTLRSHASADERLYGLLAQVVSAALAVVAAGHLGAEPDAVVVGALAVAAAVLARALPLPTVVSVLVALVAAAAGGGLVAGGLTDLGSEGALLGLAAGACALVGHRAASYDYPSRFVHMTAGVALPLAAAGPAVYFLGRALG